MKRITFLILLTAIAKTGFCQVTITGSDLPKPGELWIISADDSIIDYPLTAPSAFPQVWSYGDGVAPDTTDAVYFEDASLLPGSGTFPGSTLGINETPDFEFLTSNSTGLYINGTYDVTDPSNPDVQTPAELFIPAPFSYGDSIHSVSKSISVSFDVYDNTYDKSVSYIVEDFAADAFGSITTPLISNAKVLRVRNNSSEFDTVYSSNELNGVYTISDTFVNLDRSYLFLKNGSVSPVMEMDIDPTSGLNMGAEYIDGENVLGVRPVSANNFFTNVYPNPAGSSVITFTMQGANEQWLKIYNITGECVRTENVLNINSLTLSGNVLSGGMYYYCFIDKDGKIQPGKKFIVQ